MDSLMPAKLSRPPENADYAFQPENAILELKGLQRELFTREYRDKLRDLAFAWRNQGLIRVYGKAVLEMRKLPAPCQRQWLRLVTHSLQTNVVAKANSQIQQTKDLLNPNAEGALLLANENSVDLDPYNLIVLISNISEDAPDGSPQSFFDPCSRASLVIFLF